MDGIMWYFSNAVLAYHHGCALGMGHWSNANGIIEK